MSLNDVVRRGPQRWQRAALNAVRKPNSQAAQLYFNRVAVARQVVSETEKRGVDTRAPFAFNRLDYTATRAAGEDTWEREYATCSMFCMAMQAQLVSDEGESGVRKVLEGTRWMQCVALDTTTLVRKIRCQVCAAEIKRG